MIDPDYHSPGKTCGTLRWNADGDKWLCLNNYLHRKSDKCMRCHSEAEGYGFANKTEELEFLRSHVARLIRSQGRLTANDSMSLDYAWDSLEEYVEKYLEPTEY